MPSFSCGVGIPVVHARIHQTGSVPGGKSLGDHGLVLTIGLPQGEACLLGKLNKFGVVGVPKVGRVLPLLVTFFTANGAGKINHASCCEPLEICHYQVGSAHQFIKQFALLKK